MRVRWYVGLTKEKKRKKKEIRKKRNKQVQLIQCSVNN